MKSKFSINLGSKFGKLKGYLMLLLAAFLVLSIIRNIGKIVQIRSEVARERAKTEKQKRENDELAKKVAETQGPEFVEKEVRDKLGLVKPGETIVVLPDTETLRNLAPKPPVDEDALPDPNWKKWLKLFL